MLKKILMATLAVGALALNAPAAVADHETAECGFDSVQQADATGQNYEGAAYGYVVAGPGEAVTVKCVVYVNGNVASETPTGSGNTGATTAGRVTFTANDTDDVTICAEGTAGSHTYKNCADSTHSEFPPPEVIAALELIFDALDGVLGTIDALVIQYIDPTLCTVLSAAAGTYGPITIHPGGDVDVAGDPFWLCPPY